METPALRELMGTYFHQDWDLFGHDHMAVVDQFIVDHPDLAARLVHDIDQVLAAVKDDADLESLLDGLGCEVLPDRPGGYRTWLGVIARQASRPVPNGE